MRKTLPDVLKPRINRTGDLVELLTDAILRQEVRWIADQIVGRKPQV